MSNIIVNGFEPTPDSTETTPATKPLVPEKDDPQSKQADQNKTEAQQSQNQTTSQEQGDTSVYESLQSGNNTGTTRTALQEGGDASVYESLQSGNNKNDDDKTREADAPSQTQSATGTNSKSVVVESSNKTIPGRRTYNPLSKLSSYTYQLTWYMLNPDAVTGLIESNYRGIHSMLPGASPKPQAYIIAQSGGISDERLRMPGTPLDYYIDNFTAKTIIAGEGLINKGVEFSWDIVEPNGFSFSSKLAYAMRKLHNNSTMVKAGIPRPPTLMRQHYVMGIRFFGYDENGKIIKASDIDPEGSSEFGVFETYYLVALTELKFKIDGRATTYNIKAKTMPHTVSFGTARGLLAETTTIRGTTVEEILSTGENSLASVLNARQRKLVKDGNYETPDIYQFKFEDDSKLKTSYLSQTTDSKANHTATVARSGESTPKQSHTHPVTVKETNKTLNKNSIIHHITTLITESDFIRNGVGLLVDSFDQSSASVKGNPETELNWFVVNPLVTPYSWDSKRKDWAYNITFQIHEYRIPYLRARYASKRGKYEGPHKTYQYWLTGQNSEIISYETSMSGLYFLLQTPGAVKELGRNDDDTGNVPEHSAGTPDVSSENRGGSDVGSTIANIQNALFSVKDLAKFSMTILGDPDYLIDSMGAKTLGTEVYQKHGIYGQGFKINPIGGQIFIEIEFREGIDYGMTVDDDIISFQEHGLLGVSSRMTFNLFNPSNPDSEVLVYKVVDCTSSFRSGKFTQTITGVIADPASLKRDTVTSKAQENRKEQSSASGPSEADLGLLGMNTADMVRVPAAQTSSGIPSTQSQIRKIDNQIIDDDAILGPI